MLQNQYKLCIIADDFLKALDNLSHEEAQGRDQHYTSLLKNALVENVRIRFKLVNKFISWFKSYEPSPQYMKERCPVMLFKTDSPYSPVENIKVIAVNHPDRANRQHKVQSRAGHEHHYEPTN